MLLEYLFLISYGHKENITSSKLILKGPINGSQLNEQTFFEQKISNLKYAYVEYEIRLCAKLIRSRQFFNIPRDPHFDEKIFDEINGNDSLKREIVFQVWDDDFVTWMKCTNHIFRTASQAPIESPLTNIGSFEKLNETVNIFWEPLPWNQINGPNLIYEVIEINHSLKPKRFFAQTGAQFDLPSNYSELVFEIRSVNALGRSNKSSIVRVSSASHSFDCAVDFKIKKIYHKEYNAEWNVVDKTVVSATFFWCEMKSLMNQTTIASNECEGPMRIREFDKRVQDTQIISEIPIIIGLSCNYMNSSSGIQWSVVNRNLFHLETLNATSAIFSSEPLGTVYNVFENTVTYCELKSKSKVSCDGLTNMEKTNDSAIVLKQLKPNTFYRIERSISPCGMHLPYSCFSEPIVIKTNESAPTPPRSLQIQSKTNSSAIVTWKIPAQLNGKLKTYEIYVNNVPNGVIIANQSTEIVIYHLANLDAFTNFTFHVRACTIECSDPSIPVTFDTLIGAPMENLGPIHIQDQFNGKLVEWTALKKATGPQTFYELLVKIENRERNVRESRSIIVNYTKCILARTWCNTQMNFSVRAVSSNQTTFCVGQEQRFGEDFCQNQLICMPKSNFSFDKTRTFFGPWSKEYWHEYSCEINLVLVLIVCFVTLLMLLIASGSAYYAKKELFKNIEIELPRQLGDLEVYSSISGRKIVDDAVKATHLSQSKIEIISPCSTELNTVAATAPIEEVSLKKMLLHL